jgi:hydrogenase maturation factor
MTGGPAMPSRIPVGKLPASFLAELLKRYALPDPRVLVGPGIGQDAAVIEMGDRCLIAKSDPVTFAVDEIGWYAVHVNANDIACCGGIPRWFLATLLLPERGTTEALVESIYRQISDACRQLGVALCGGHTEITCGLDRPIVAGHMFGEASRDGYLAAGGARVGDRVILTKGIAVEGTALIAREKADDLRNVLSADELKRCAAFLRVPGISVVREAEVAHEAGGVHALHDPTEGGLATGLWELAQASGVGLAIDEVNIPVLPECERICRHFQLDPLGLIGSGSLLISAAPAQADAIVSRLKEQGVAADVIGTVLPAGNGCVLRSGSGIERPLPQFARDEIARLFEPL